MFNRKNSINITLIILCSLCILLKTIYFVFISSENNNAVLTIIFLLTVLKKTGARKWLNICIDILLAAVWMVAAYGNNTSFVIFLLCAALSFKLFEHIRYKISRGILKFIIDVIMVVIVFGGLICLNEYDILLYVPLAVFFIYKLLPDLLNNFSGKILYLYELFGLIFGFVIFCYYLIFLYMFMIIK